MQWTSIFFVNSCCLSLIGSVLAGTFADVLSALSKLLISSRCLLPVDYRLVLRLFSVPLRLRGSALLPAEPIGGAFASKAIGNASDHDPAAA